MKFEVGMDFLGVGNTLEFQIWAIVLGGNKNYGRGFMAQPELRHVCTI